MQTTLEGTTLAGRYRLGERLGHGGMADVYDGHDIRLDRPVAVKVLRAEMAAQDEVRNRFEHEARAAARLSHPNVVAVFDTGEAGGLPFIVMERLPGTTLADRMAEGPLDEDLVRRVAGDVLGALAVAHAAGLIHRDVKPANILLNAEGCAKVADFGIAKSMEVVEGSDATGTNLLLGTPAYLAPERIEGKPATVRSDLFSLGVVLHEALTGQRAFTGSTPVVIADAVMRGDVAPVLSLRPDVDPQLAAAVDRALRPDPAERFASADEMAAAIGVAPAAVAVAPGGPGGADATAVLPLAAAAPIPNADPTVAQQVRPPAAAAAAPLAALPVAWREWMQDVDWRKRRGALLAGAGAVLLLLLLAVGALGGDGDAQAPAAEETPTTITTSPPTTEAPEVDEDKDEDDDHKGRGKGRKGDD